jgi:hypothetical protein
MYVKFSDFVDNALPIMQMSDNCSTFVSPEKQESLSSRISLLVSVALAAINIWLFREVEYQFAGLVMGSILQFQQIPA